MGLTNYSNSGRSLFSPGVLRQRDVSVGWVPLECAAAARAFVCANLHPAASSVSRASPAARPQAAACPAAWRVHIGVFGWRECCPVSSVVTYSTQRWRVTG